MRKFGLLVLTLQLMIVTSLYADDLTMLTVRGSHYEMGFQHGLAYRAEILNNLEEMATPEWGCDPDDPNDVATANALLADQYAAVEAAYPWVFDEIEGIADGAGIDYDKVRLLSFRAWDVMCTTIGAVLPGCRTESGAADCP